MWTIEELHSNEELRQHEFPVTRTKCYFGNAGVCALPRRVADAMRSYAGGCTDRDQETVFPPGWFTDLRKLAARFIGANADEIAFVAPTSLGLSYVAGGLKFRRDQHVLVYQDDYPSNVYPWMNLSERGVEVRFLNLREFGCIRSRDVLGQVDENTRLVAISSCHFLSGIRIDLEEIGAALRTRNILLCVDAIQTIGAFPTPAHSADFMAADAHKWMLGPCAAGLFYVRKEVQEQLTPIVQGWHNIRCPNYVAQDELNYKPDARRYEAGSHNIIGLAGMRAGLELLDSIGVEAIARELLRKRAWLIPALQNKGYEVLNAGASPQNGSGIVSFAHPGKDLVELHRRLEENNIITSLRGDRKGRKLIRLSPHFYNTDAELHRLLELL